LEKSLRERRHEDTIFCFYFRFYDQAAVAEDEAQLQEQLKRQNAEDLKTLEAEKNHLTKKAKSEIANAEYRRVKAEKDAAKYDAEIKTLKRQIASLKDHISQVQAKAEDAEGLAEEERAELNQYREERRALLKKLHDKQTTSKKKAKDLEAYHNAADSNYDF
jgi:chromosome segregation ATPase